ncbi:hypothetical protein OG338_03040 [Streptomyces sp. NBC_00726]|uniref:hypothetical protein n=1 Tax=Streptomyces sp. NBC_00726 TaxID=2903674 RepID=UPI003869944F
MDNFDLAVIGFGIRGLGLITANPELRAHRVLIADAGTRLGAGAFARILSESNSHGSDFFNWVDPDGPYGPIRALAPVRELRARTDCFDLQLLARALGEAAEFVRATAPPHWSVVREAVAAVELADGGPLLRFGGGRTARARKAVLACGVRERQALAREAVLSSTLLAVPDEARAQEVFPGARRFTIVGTAHSAFSALAKLTALGVDARAVTMTGRSPVRLHYPSYDAYRSAEHPAGEAVPDPVRDVCPRTGQVFRYHGLRNRSRALFGEVARGRLPVRLVIDRGGRVTRREADAADVVIQATGYVSDLPGIVRAGEPVATRPVALCDSDGVLLDADGLRVPGIHLMGCDPYPYKSRFTDPTVQYADRGAAVLAALEAGRHANL